ncbi:DUF2163 domain-containing protein [Rubellimicrobium sp. CFH 75288]|uniref:DUF2163 domain-containing protein n=1 Tax=Rubellimicrobium sp. CFH 75288 TaxID=2697034 RepID=UPI0014129F03|nr:DUF2163 domain-containing protein [Rubellimicrobium sp. CFH 75288]NAZ35515.1 DUF2163 domain-containing protein [Rubellimicrobium sp. CFH 75288]
MSLAAHLASGATTLCRCWAVTRRDGVVLGFTDHDRPLSFAGIDFRPETGLSARALVSGTGLAVDNAEAAGTLSSDGIAEADIEAGLFDGAELRQWIVNWAAPAQRRLRFRGHLGEIRREGAAFHAELRGLSEGLNRPLGRLYERTCPAALGDAACGFDLGRPGYTAEAEAPRGTEGGAFRLSGLGAFAPRWFERGRLLVLSGPARGLSGTIKHDRIEGETRTLELWAPLARAPRPGDRLRLEPGCDKRAETCRLKFANIANFRGFPFIPGDDWLLAAPARGPAPETTP